MDKESTNHLDIEKGLLELWLEILNSMKAYSNKIILDCFFSLRVKFMIKVLNQIGKENRLSKYDERIFDYFHKLMWYYEQTISLYEQDKDIITNSKAKKIMEGIYTVLSSQLKQFEENQQHEYICLDKRSIKNPISIEKDEIIVKAKNLVLDSVETMLNSYTKSKQAACFKYVISELLNSNNSHDSYIKILNDIYLNIINDNIDNLYNVYSNITKDSTSKINNLQFRKAANFYYESIKQEKEILENIITVQVNALVDELKYMDIEVLEQQKINEILDTLIEAYQHLKREIESLAIYFKETENMIKEIEILNKPEFTDYIIDKGAKAYVNDLSQKPFPNDIFKLNNAIDLSKSNFKYKINELTNEIIDYKVVCINQNNNISDYITNFISEKANMIIEFINCFIGIKDFYELNSEALLNTKYNEILKGIYETIQIKLESLEENKKSFLESLKLLEASVKASITAKSKKVIEEDILAYWYSKCPLSSNSFIEALEGLYIAIEHHDLILKYVEGLKKQNQQQQLNLNKKYLQFLKESLLFELTTYEEILNYSISKIKEETELDIIKNFVLVIDETTQKLENLLLKYNIDTIKPKPHDLFNGKEHEVLMVEKQDDFEKGQIVKLMNTGYKYNDCVIIRANVIAAK